MDEVEDGLDFVCVRSCRVIDKGALLTVVDKYLSCIHNALQFHRKSTCTVTEYPCPSYRFFILSMEKGLLIVSSTLMSAVCGAVFPAEPTSKWEYYPVITECAVDFHKTLNHIK